MASSEPVNERSDEFAARVRVLVSRIRQMKGDASGLAGGIAAALKAAERHGLNRAALRAAVRYADMEPAAVRAEIEALWRYLSALGILAGDPPSFVPVDLAEEFERVGDDA